MLHWAQGGIRELTIDDIGEHYGRYRLHLPDAERAMAPSLERYGQISPLVVCLREGHYELIDGFKRLAAARLVSGISRVSIRLILVDERGAKAAIYGLNRAGGKTRELEEAWIVHALVREDGLTQVEVAELLGRHKSWVCRRMALIERLGPEAKDELRVGLLCPTAARQIVRLPEGNQAEALAVIRREALSAIELAAMVDLLLECPGRRQQEFILQNPATISGQKRTNKNHLPGSDDRLNYEVLKGRFEELGPQGGFFFERLVQTRRYGRDEANRILSLLSSYRRVDLGAAIDRASRYRAFSLSVIERILAAQAQPRSGQDYLDSETRTNLRRIGGDPVPPRSTAEYQKLLKRPGGGG